jgi:glutathione S-transferase
VAAKGLAPTLCLEVSGLEYTGTAVQMDAWPELKGTGACPFGQMPLLKTPSGVNFAQATAVCNYVGKCGGLEGANNLEYGLSQMLLAEGEDLYNMMQKHQDTLFAKDKESAEENAKFWAEGVTGQFGFLENILKGKDTFTTSGTTVGELYLFAMLHLMKMCKPAMLEGFPALASFFAKLAAHPKVKAVCAGESQMGPMLQYFQCS